MKRKITNALTLRKAASTGDMGTSERSSIHSCYKGGTDGVCSVCSNAKLSCNCQHCRCCGSYLLAMRSRHHCRMCWRPFCPRCSNKQRVVEFMGGARKQPSRTCITCAIPQGLLHVFGMFDTYGALRKEGVVPLEAANASSDYPIVGGSRFLWGLYALVSVVDAPRRCINPNCSSELLYNEVCAKCKVPTVTSALHQVRHVPQVTGSGSSKVDTNLVRATEDAVAREHNAIVDSLTASDVDSLYLTRMPNHADAFALHGMRDDTWSARKAMLSRLAATVAGEWQSCPNISLAMSDTPEATLLRIVRVEQLFTVFESPAMVRYVAFAPTMGRKALDRRLASTIHNRQVWSTSRSDHLGVIVSDERMARQRGGKKLVGEFGATEALLHELEDNEVYDDLTHELLAMMGEGADIVLCGFSTGGSIASLLSARLLIEHTDVTCDRLMCVTFGAPLVGNRGLTELLQSCPRANLCHKFQHFVNGSDIMPRLSFLSTFLSAGTLGATTGGGEQGMPGDETNMGEVRDLILTWLTLSQQQCRDVAHATGHVSPTAKSKKEKKQLTKEKKTAVSMQELTTTTDGSSSVTNTYYEGRKSISSSDDEDEHVESPRTTTGDIFAHTREPFDNNRDGMRTTVSASGEVTSPLLAQIDVSAFETEEYRNLQILDPFGCYNILWCGQDMYVYSDDPGKTLAALSDRSSMRVLLQDHLMSSYNRAIFEYMNAAA